MSNTESEKAPKTQPALTGGPPKPPTRTARGLEDGSPEPEFTKLDSVNAKLDIVDRLIGTVSKQLLDPDLSAGPRAELRKMLKEMRSDKRRFQDQKRELQNQESEGH